MFSTLPVQNPLKSGVIFLYVQVERHQPLPQIRISQESFPLKTRAGVSFALINRPWTFYSVDIFSGKTMLPWFESPENNISKANLSSIELIYWLCSKDIQRRFKPSKPWTCVILSLQMVLATHATQDVHFRQSYCWELRLSRVEVGHELFCYGRTYLM